MTRAQPPPDFELDGVSPDEAFAVLGNDTRLDILKAMWDAGAHHEYDDMDDTAMTISFSELQRAVDMQDNGQFNYHLSQLIPSFVRHTDDGYRLSGAGKKVYQAVVAISGERNLDMSNELEAPCPLCGGALTAVYEDQWLRVMCTDCEGNFGDTTPDGTVFHAPLPAAGLTGRTPDEALSAGTYRCILDLTYLMRGICRECTSPLASSVSICEDHDSTDSQSCSVCGTHYAVWGDLHCAICRFAKRLPIELCALGLTPVIAFLHERGIDVLSPSYHELEEVESLFHTSVTKDPLRVTITITDDPDEMTVTVDDELTLVDSTC